MAVKQETPLLTIGDAAKKYRIAKRTVHRWIKGGFFERVQPVPGGLVYVKEKEKAK